MVIRTDSLWGDVIAWVIIACLTPVWLPMLVLGVAWNYAAKLKRRLLGPYSDRWQLWSAWYPVSVSTAEVVWLERVWRKATDSSPWLSVTNHHRRSMHSHVLQRELWLQQQLDRDLEEDEELS